MSVHEAAWRVTPADGGEPYVVRRRSEADEARAQGADVKAVSFKVSWREGRRQRSKAFTRRRDAERYDADVKRRLEAGEPIIRRRDVPTLDELAEEWFERREADVRDGQLAIGTLSELAGLMDRYVSPYLGYLHVIDLTAPRLDAWIGELREQGAPPYRIRRAHGLLSRLLAHAVRLGYLPGNPARELELPSHSYRRGRVATIEQVETMRRWFLERDRLGDATLISVLAEGLRPAEALALGWSDFDGRRLHVATHLRDGTPIEGTKRGRRAEMGPPRWVVLADPHAADVAEWRIAMGRPHGLIFPRASDARAWRKYDWDNWRKRSFRKAAESAGLPADFRPYDLRHTAASLLLAAGRPISEVADHLGHSVDVCARTYAHVVEACKGKPLTPVDEAIRAARGEVERGSDVARELRG